MFFYSLIVIIGALLIIGGVSLAYTPLLTFMNAGYYIIILLIIAGILGIIRSLNEKKYDKEFAFSILSLILGVAGLLYPGAATMDNNILLYLYIVWLLIDGAITIVTAIRNKRENGLLSFVFNIVMGLADFGMVAYSLFNPSSMASDIGFLIGLYYIKYGFDTIVLGSTMSKGSNIVTLIFTIIGILMIIGGFSFFATPLNTFINIRYCILLLFLLNGVAGIVKAINQSSYDKNFVFAILSLLLGVAGYTIKGFADLSSNNILLIAGIWFLVHGAFTILMAIENKNRGDSFLKVLGGYILGAVEIIVCLVSVFKPSLLASNLGLMAGVFFIESGLNMILVGADVSSTVAQNS